MKSVVIMATAFAVATIQAQPSFLDQIKTKINEINQLAWSIPEAKPLLHEYNKI